MGWGPWITCGWPGLSRLWWRGQWSGFFAAACFAVWMNGSLAATFLFPHVVPSWAAWGSWAALAILWMVCVRRAATGLAEVYAGEGRRNNELFSRAQEEYLRGQWFEAESLLLRLVRDDPADVEGRLLLATLYRHTQRADLAKTQLAQLQRSPQAGRWRWEIHRERQLLEQVGKGPSAASDAALEPPLLDDAMATGNASDAGGADHAAGANEISSEAAPETAAREGIGGSDRRDGLSKAA